MIQAATVPLTIDPDAAAYLAEIGQEAELEVILDHIKATIPNLRALRVLLYDFPETGSLNLTIEAQRDPCPRTARPGRLGLQRVDYRDLPARSSCELRVDPGPSL